VAAVWQAIANDISAYSGGTVTGLNRVPLAKQLNYFIILN